MQPHLIARPVLDRGAAADRLRNHLRRRAIVRLGLIEGDLYMVPYWRARGRGPEGENTFHLLGAELGDPRLARVALPPADLAPFDAALVPAGARLVPASMDSGAVTARGHALGWRAEALEALIHYPFWLMRVEDSGRFEGAWIDGVEGKVIHHSLKVPPPIPSMKLSAGMLAGPAALMGAAASLVGRPAPLAVATLVLAVAGGLGVMSVIENGARRERDG